MTDFARGLWCGAFGVNGESPVRKPSAARAFAPSKWASASEPSPPAETRRNERRLSEKSGSIHIKKRVARQQHLAEVSPDANLCITLIFVDIALLADEILRSGKFVLR